MSLVKIHQKLTVKPTPTHFSSEKFNPAWCGFSNRKFTPTHIISTSTCSRFSMTWFFIYTSDIVTSFSDILCLIFTNACKDMQKRLIVNSNQKNSVFEILLMRHFVKLLDHWLSKKRCISTTQRSMILNFRVGSNDWLYIYVYWSINLLEIVLSDKLIMLQELYEDKLND